ncbi:Uu.00g105350.m01.CDS01 [Anthostomella pinea]|uniref:Uu.00g105350.m01.CDS01 n=1 Tax=Anthostomella pinea TaxID=933095 RepID=A0AAI8VDS7_9PEZI|nr:Uu.00g105350.m01.CDS01 [Anthostomella pinea]
MSIDHNLTAAIGASAEDRAGSYAVMHVLAATVIVALFSYIFTQRRGRKKVSQKSQESCVHMPRTLLTSLVTPRQLETAIAEQHNCKPVIPFVPYKWPLALDLLKRQYYILFSDNTFERLTPFFDLAGTCRIHLFGNTGYFTTDPENIEAILYTRFDDYGLGSRRLAFFSLLGEGIFGQDGPAWKRSRELIRHQFVRVQKQIPEAFTPLVDELVSGIAEAAVDEQVDLKPLMYQFTLATTTMLLFGEPHSSMAKEERDAVRDNFDYAAFGCGIRVRLADVAWLYNPAKYRNACRANDFGEEAAAEKYAFIIDFFHLVRNPVILERLLEEIASVPTGGDITRDQIQRLPFLRCWLNETLRLYPTLPLNLRSANKPTVLPRGGGSDGRSPVLLPKGAGITHSVYHLHRLESIYGPDSRVYRPQRWEDGELIRKARLGAGYVDFNAGPRLCLGKDFALMEASYAIVRVLQAYPSIRLALGTPN